ncbi:AsnC family transcriptional regulator [Mycolicibacterium goodii]|uniref:AsnC family transcriptional regulator n=1 Tax=Mycolicibacterium goodii TaxID=134601 RepID=A0A0K0XFJ3_MYCGD|nr:AsnC family transcriptional regulator [Mycolicibacterium goodii]
MDDLDAAIITSMQADGRRSHRDLAAELGVSPSTVFERMRSLRQREVLLGVHYSADLTELGRPVQAMLSVRLRPQSREVMDSFREFVMQLPETVQVFVTTGADDLLLHVAVSSTHALHAFVLDSLTKRREVAGVRTDVVLDHERQHVITPVR